MGKKSSSFFSATLSPQSKFFVNGPNDMACQVSFWLVFANLILQIFKFSIQLFQQSLKNRWGGGQNFLKTVLKGEKPI